jgi:uncharacterized Zn finger protein (UPF0148 family)
MNPQTGTIACPFCGSASITPAEFRPESPPQRVPSSDGLTHSQKSEVAQLIREGQLIQAIKVYRVATGEGLLESKNAVEKIRDELK